MKRVLSLVFLLSLVGAGVWAYSSVHDGASAPAYRFARVERGPLAAAVSATGNLNAVITVQVGSQVSGQITQLSADFNSVVRQGDVIARIDPEIFEAKVNQAKADLDSAKAAHDSAVAQLDSARAHEQALASAIQSAIAQLRVAEAMLASARAQVKQKAAALHQAKVDLDHATIRAPVDGVVISRAVDIGQ